MAQNLEEEVAHLRGEVSRLQHRLHEQKAELEDRQKLATSNNDDVMGVSDLLWRACPPLWCGVVRPHLVTLGNAVYVGGGNSRNLETSRSVHKYTPGNHQWESLPITPYLTFALSTVDDQLTVIGGVNTISSLTSSDLLTFDPDVKKWKKVLPPMPTKRCAASATSLNGHLVVTGGISEDGSSYLDTVEMFDGEKREWSRACSLPKPASFMSITSCAVTNRIYLLGGLTKQGSIRSVFSCVLKDLVESSAQQKSDKEGKSENSVWETITDTPHHRMGCIAMRGKLVVASGLSEQDKTTRSVHSFDPVSRQWETMGDMAAARTSCSLASLGNGRLMVVGGYVNPSNWMTSLTTDVMECVNFHLK